MEHPLRTALRSLTALFVVFTPLAGLAQEAEVPEFEIENAVLDTSILFVTGAQEAVQELRGAFGWPTFQEGLADGIYYRFDPDGYARFAPTARLDADVFEVICRSRTVTCGARKGILGLNPTNTGQYQMAIEDFVEGEQFFLIEGTTEIQLPAQILDPLDARLESLLSSNGELVVRRGADERARVSLAGFRQTLAYLRWVAARQDYAALPYGWPVPNGGTVAPARLTAPDAWSNPMVQSPTVPVIAAAAASGSTDVAEVEALRRELETLRSLISPSSLEPALAPAMDPALAPTIPAAPSPQTATATPVATELPTAATDQADAARLAALETIVATLSAGLVAPGPCGTNAVQPCRADASAANTIPVVAPIVDLSPADTMPDFSAAPLLPSVEAAAESFLPAAAATANSQTALLPVAVSPVIQTSQRDPAAQVDYLMTEIGLDAETALMVLQLGPLGQNRSAGGMSDCNGSTLNLAFSDAMTRQALADLAEPLPNTASGVELQLQAGPDSLNPGRYAAGPGAEYVFLSDYLQSIYRPIGGK